MVSHVRSWRGDVMNNRKTYLPCGGDPAGLCIVGDVVIAADCGGEIRPMIGGRGSYVAQWHHRSHIP